MKKEPSDAPEPANRPSESTDELRAEYDPALIREGVRGKYAARYAEGTNLVLLDPDVAAAFPDSEAVNRVLRALIEIAQRENAAGRKTSAA